MSFRGASVPPLGSLSSILASNEQIIQQNWGIAAGIDGQLYDAYRLNTPAPSNGTIESNPPIARRFHMRPEQTKKKTELENGTFELLTYRGICDARNFKEQDVLKQRGILNDLSVFTLVQHRPTRWNVFIRTESSITLSRPWSPAGRADQQPSGAGPAAVSTPGWSGFAKSEEIPLALVNGSYFFDDTGLNPAATVWCGLQPIHRIGDTPKSTAAGDMPTALYRERFVAYVPDIPGDYVNELDRLNFPATGDRYEVMLVYTSLQTGITGYLCIVEKLST